MRATEGVATPRGSVAWTFGAISLSLVLLAPGLARAAVDAGASETSTLELQIDQQSKTLSMLSTAPDCASACKALASIQRAAARICELEPGPRCDAAKAKATDATKRVRDACPECAAALAPPAPEAPNSSKEMDLSERKEMAATAPSSAEPPRGGCRSCATASGAPDRSDLAVFGLVALFVARRRKKDRRAV